MKKITFVISSISNFGGAERITCGLANELADRGYKVAILTLYNENNSFFELRKEIEVKKVFKKVVKPSKYYIPVIPFLIYKFFRKKENRPDIMIGVFTDMIMYSIMAKMLLKIKYICWEHFNFDGGDATGIIPRISRKLSEKFIDAMVVLTPNDKILFEQNLSLHCPVVAIPNFMSFKASSVTTLNNKVALAVGRLSPEKGFDTLIKIWELVSKQHPDWILKIVGDGEERPLLEKIVKDGGLSTKVFLLPRTTEVSKYYQEAAVFLLTSRWEGFGMVILEAKSHGVPVVSFNCSGPLSLIDEDTNSDGILVPLGNVEKFAAEINALLQDKERLKIMSKNSLKNSEKWQPSQVVPQWENLILETLNLKK